MNLLQAEVAYSLANAAFAAQQTRWAYRYVNNGTTPMAGLNYATALWPLGPYTLGAGQSGEWVITYPPSGFLVSFNAVWPWDYGIQFNLETTGVIANGISEETLPDNTQYFITVTNEGDSPGQFAFILEAIYF